MEGGQKDIQKPIPEEALNNNVRHLPRKRFGQHFLVDKGEIRRIIGRARLTPSDFVLEIGPGRGALTVPLAGHVEKILAVEMDRDLIPILEEKLHRAGITNVTLINEDILRFDLEKLGDFYSERAVVLGNLPYNISSPVLELLVSHRDRFQRAVLMFQKEVADRLVARPGSRTYGALSVLIGYHAEVTRLLKVGREAFRPKPKVDSAVVQLDFERPYPRKVKSEKWFRNVVKGAFAHRRKTIQNSLMASFPFHDREQIGSALSGCGIESNRRAETLTMDNFIDLASALRNE